jgi:VanZ family protein
VLKNIFLTAALFWTGIILFFCLENAKNIPSINILHLDKVIHLTFHFIFTILWFLYFKKKFKNSNNFNLLAITLFVSFVFGIVIELIQQYFTTTRNADVFDILANLIGAFLASIIITLVNAYNGIIDKI